MTDVLFTKTRCSQEVEEASHFVVRYNMVLLCVCADLMGVHAYHRDLDWSRKIKVVVAQVVCSSFEILLIQGACVIGDTVKHRLSSSYGSLVRDQIEIEKLVALLLNNTGVHTGSWAWVEAVPVLLVEESVLNVSIDEANDNLRLVVLSGVFKHVSYYLNFVFLNLLGH